MGEVPLYQRCLVQSTAVPQGSRAHTWWELLDAREIAQTRVLQGYQAHKKPPPPYSSICLGMYGAPSGGCCFL